MPVPLDWKNSMHAEGFSGELSTDFDVDKLRGFLPCSLSGEPSGFEYFSSSFVPSEEEALEGLQLPSGIDFRVEFVTHGGRNGDLIVAIAAASTLCKKTGGLLLDPQSGESFSSEEAIEWAKGEISKLEFSSIPDRAVSSTPRRVPARVAKKPWWRFW